MIQINLPKGYTETLHPDMLPALSFVVTTLINLREATAFAVKRKTFFSDPMKKANEKLIEVSVNMGRLSPEQKMFATMIAVGWTRGEISLSALGDDYMEEAKLLLNVLAKMVKLPDGRTPSSAELNKMYVELGVDKAFM